MKKKILLFILCLFLTTGCDIEYDLNINNNSYDETITMSFLKSQNNYSDISIYAENKTPITNNPDDNNYYESKIEDNENYYDLIYHYKHDLDSFRQSYFLSNCYPDFDIEDNDKQIVLSSGNTFMCFQGDDGLKADSVKVNIVTELKVLDNNADIVNGNTYTWTINENNYQNKPIEMLLEKSLEIEDIIPRSEASNLSFIVVAVIIFVALIVIVFVRHKAKKNNNI